MLRSPIKSNFLLENIFSVWALTETFANSLVFGHCYGLSVFYDKKICWVTMKAIKTFFASWSGPCLRCKIVFLIYQLIIYVWWDDYIVCNLYNIILLLLIPTRSCFCLVLPVLVNIIQSRKDRRKFFSNIRNKPK